MLGRRYDSEEALGLASSVMGALRSYVHEASHELAGERGMYPSFFGSEYNDRMYEMRNTAPTTIAPTGTISIIAGCSSGIEPLYGIRFIRTVMDGSILREYHPMLAALADWAGDVPAWVGEVFRTAHQISPYWHVRMQAAFQQHTDNAVSKTINLPEDATVADVREAYELAHRLGCKGITVYRNASKRGQVLS